MTQKRYFTLSSVLIDLLIVLSIILLDQVTKELAIHHLKNQPSHQLFQLWGIDGYLTFATNKGAAWGIFHEMPALLCVIRIFFIGLLFSFYMRGIFGKTVQLGLLLLLSGALSNMIDSILLGYVVDMIHLRFWEYDYPIFNLADCFITTGACICMLPLLFPNCFSSE